MNKSLTDNEITKTAKSSFSDYNEIGCFISGAKWARERMLESMLQEVEKCIEWGVSGNPPLTGSEYLTKIKEKYGI